MFTPARLTLARKRRGKTKAELARILGVVPRRIYAYEVGEYAPRDDEVAIIARALGFPLDFFSGPPIDMPPDNGVSFRSMKAMSASKRDAALGAAAIGGALWEWIDARFQLPKPNVPDLRSVAPEAAAEALRAEWNLGERPVKNVVHLLEAHGVRVMSLAERNREVDAFSFWRGETPCVFLNTEKTAEHGRFDAAHELGHLVMHRHGGSRGKGYEREADAFASAFLMPRSSVLASGARFTTVDALVDLKTTWNVSVAALNYRLHGVGLTSEWNYRHACIEISKRGFRTKEPNPAPRETSQVLHKVFEALRAEGLSRLDVAMALHVDVGEIDALVFRLVGQLTHLRGGGAIPTPVTDKANLRKL